MICHEKHRMRLRPSIRAVSVHCSVEQLALQAMHSLPRSRESNSAELGPAILPAGNSTSAITSGTADSPNSNSPMLSADKISLLYAPSILAKSGDHHQQLHVSQEDWQ